MSDIIIEYKNSTVIVTLNREKVLNALNLNMVQKISENIKTWNESSNISGIILKGAGEKAFCAGGDIVSVYHTKNDKNNSLSYDFFREEYLMNIAIKNFTKPWISLLNGYAMGGGLGLSVHGSHRIVTEKTVTAMPETAIGLFPDVGGGYFLSRMQSSLGKYLAVTGNTMDFKSTLFSGIGTHFIEVNRLNELVDKIISLRAYSFKEIDSLLINFNNNISITNSSLEQELGLISKYFVAESMKDILKSLNQDVSEWSKAILKILSKKSPTSMSVAVEQLTRAKDMSFEACMAMEFRICQAMMAKHDFYEGVRANLVEKDRKPRWDPSDLSDVTQEIIDEHFDNLGQKELIDNG